MKTDKQNVKKFAEYINESFDEWIRHTDDYLIYSRRALEKAREFYNLLSKEIQKSYAVKSDLNEMEKILRLEVTA